MVQNVSRNIPLLYGIGLSNNMLFLLPTFVLFLASKGISVAQLFVLQVIFSIVMLFCEVPCGYICDRIGRKKTIILGSFLLFISYSLYSFVYAFWLFIVAEILCALARSFLSGTLEAMGYETLVQNSLTQHSRVVASRQQSVLFFGEVLSGIIGGLLAMISILLPAFCTLIPLGFSFLLAFFLIEPRQHTKQTLPSRTFFSQSHAIVDLCKKTPVLVYFLSLGSLSLVGTLFLFWSTQPYQSLVLLPTVWWGVLFTVYGIIGFFAALTVPALERWFSDIALLCLLSISILCCFFVLGFFAPHMILLVCFVIGRIGFSIFMPLLNDVINRFVDDSSLRVTVLSLPGFLTRSLFIILAPGFAFMINVYDITTALQMLALILLLITTLVLYVFRYVSRITV